MTYVIAVLQHDFLGKIEMMSQRETFEEVERIATAVNPFADDDDLQQGENTHYSSIIWEGTLDDPYTGALGKPLAIYYRGEAWVKSE